MSDKPKREIVLEVISGVEGSCVAINQYRFFGPKPWGGGRVIQKWKTNEEDFIKSLKQIGIEMALAPEKRARRDIEQRPKVSIGRVHDYLMMIGVKTGGYITESAVKQFIAILRELGHEVEEPK